MKVLFSMFSVFMAGMYAQKALSDFHMYRLLITEKFVMTVTSSDPSVTKTSMSLDYLNNFGWDLFAAVLFLGVAIYTYYRA